MSDILNGLGKSISLRDLDDVKKSIAEKVEKDGIYENISSHNLIFIDALIGQLENYFIKS